MLIVIYLVSFFFSSRRRHTRFSRDWNSDVCSSDLPTGLLGRDRRRHRRGAVAVDARDLDGALALLDGGDVAQGHLPATRSEERRVGKECRSRRTLCSQKKSTMVIP